MPYCVVCCQHFVPNKKVSSWFLDSVVAADSSQQQQQQQKKFAVTASAATQEWLLNKFCSARCWSIAESVTRYNKERWLDTHCKNDGNGNNNKNISSPYHPLSSFQTVVPALLRHYADGVGTGGNKKSSQQSLHTLRLWVLQLLEKGSIPPPSGSSQHQEQQQQHDLRETLLILLRNHFHVAFPNVVVAPSASNSSASLRPSPVPTNDNPSSTSMVNNNQSDFADQFQTYIERYSNRSPSALTLLTTRAIGIGQTICTEDPVLQWPEHDGENLHAGGLPTPVGLHAKFNEEASDVEKVCAVHSTVIPRVRPRDALMLVRQARKKTRETQNTSNAAQESRLHLVNNVTRRQVRTEITAQERESESTNKYQTHNWTSALFGVISKAQYDCAPNAAYDPYATRSTPPRLVACRPLRAGVAVTVSPFDSDDKLLMGTHARRSLMHKTKGILCICPRCEGSNQRGARKSCDLGRGMMCPKKNCGGTAYSSTAIGTTAKESLRLECSPSVSWCGISVQRPRSRHALQRPCWWCLRCDEEFPEVVMPIDAESRLEKKIATLLDEEPMGYTKGKFETLRETYQSCLTSLGRAHWICLVLCRINADFFLYVAKSPRVGDAKAKSLARTLAVKWTHKFLDVAETQDVFSAAPAYIATILRRVARAVHTEGSLRQSVIMFLAIAHHLCPVMQSVGGASLPPPHTAFPYSDMDHQERLEDYRFMCRELKDTVLLNRQQFMEARTLKSIQLSVFDTEAKLQRVAAEDEDNWFEEWADYLSDRLVNAAKSRKDFAGQLPPQLAAALAQRQK